MVGNVHIGEQAHITRPGYEYDGTVLGFHQLRDHTEQPVDKWLISIRCGCCGHVDMVDERFVERRSRDAAKV